MTSIEGFSRLGDADHTLFVADDFRAEIEPLDLLGAGGFERLRARGVPIAGGRGATWTLELPGSRRRLHVRPVTHGGALRHVTGRRFRTLDRPLRELDVASRLRGRDVRVPCPVFVLGNRRGLFWEAYIATVFVTNTESGGDFLRSSARAVTPLTAARAAGRAIRQFHDAGGTHPDLHVDNLLLQPPQPGQDEPTVWIVDLDQAAIVKEVDPEERARELMRLYRSLLKRNLDEELDARARRAFLSSYTAGDRHLRDALIQALTRERARTALHALAYRRPAS